jgi:prepilin-type N-terminal cleavage/methylation domain-containing protein
MNQHIRQLRRVLLMHSMPANYPSSARRGFTIVELLVVIVIIAILASITVVAYSGVSQRAITSSLQSDLTNIANRLKAYQVLYGSYPTALDVNNCPTAPNADSAFCLKTSNSGTISYDTIAGKTFHMTASNSNAAYSITDNTSPAIATTAAGSSTGSACPSGFIPVPGSGTYGTNDFCVMKYEAKNAGGATYAANVSGCTGCHLITEAERMTIAQNVLSVASNWSGGSVGSGYIYSGHNDNNPVSTIDADSNDANGYYGTNNASGNQRRTLTLTNGQVIWDFAGNVWEWTSGQNNGNQPGIAGESGFAWKEWGAVNTNGNLAVSPFPNSTGISGATSWNSSNGIGTIYSYAGEPWLRGIVRGGSRDNGSDAGVLAISLALSPDTTYMVFGFRVSR